MARLVQADRTVALSKLKTRETEATVATVSLKLVTRWLENFACSDKS